MKTRWLLAAIAAAVLVTPFGSAAEKSRGLDIYFADVEGGAATLIVTPTGESVLIDCGDRGNRDADRINKMAREQAGLKAIDHLLITHWHSDHYGGTGRLAQLIPIRHFYDRGIPDKLAEDKNFALMIQAYKEASHGKSKTLKPGSEIALKQEEGGPALRLLTLCGQGNVLPDKADAPENPIAKEHKPQPDDPTDNAKSLGFLLSYGGFRFLNLGDLTWNIEYKLVHPTDKIGPVDVYQATHHGLEISNNPVVINTVKPRVAIFSNGPKKGAHPTVIATLRRVPDLQAIYQIHRNELSTPAENTDPEFIANADSKCEAQFIRLSVAPDAKSYTVMVGGKGKLRKYETRTQ